MAIAKALNWRLWLIMTHRWLGIAIGLVFVMWSISGIVLMYYGVPHLTAGERLMRLPALDLSSARVTPAEAARQVDGEPFRLRISMLGDRPVYRINTGRVFGAWTVVYADNGEVLHGLDAAAALEWLGRAVPEHAESLRYDAYLEGPDLFTHNPALQTHMPMHRIALGDAAASVYYVSERSGEAVMKTDRTGRVLGFTGYILHTLFFFRQQGWWGAALRWLSWTGLAMCVLGTILGITRFALAPRYVQRGVPSRSPYTGLMKWHHYAGLVFALPILAWVFSGLVSLAEIPGIRETTYTPAQIQAGARSVQGEGARLDFAPLTLENLRAAAAAVDSRFTAKELELIHFDGEPYFIAYRAPPSAALDDWETQSALDFIAPALDQDHALVSALRPESGTFERFSDDAMLRAARLAMPGAEVRAATWLTEFDEYYYNSVASFDLGLMKTAKTLPVLRVEFDDPLYTWLYMTPSHGQIVKYEKLDRANRWGYYGLHAFDFAFLYERRPLWDVVVIVLLLGSVLVSTTTLLPMMRRLKRHALRLWGKLLRALKPGSEYAAPPRAQARSMPRNR